jgi:hypothetical protein
MRFTSLLISLLFLSQSIPTFASRVEKLQDVEFTIDTLQHYNAGPGTIYTSLNLKSESKNLNVFVLEMDMTEHDNVEYRMEIGNDTTLSVEAISSVAKRKWVICLNPVIYMRAKRMVEKSLIEPTTFSYSVKGILN